MKHITGIVVLLFLICLGCTSTGGGADNVSTPEATPTEQSIDSEPVKATPTPIPLSTPEPTQVPEVDESLKKEHITLGCYKEIEEYITGLIRSPRFTAVFPDLNVTIESLPSELFHETILDGNKTYDLAIVYSDYLAEIHSLGNTRSLPVDDIKDALFPTFLSGGDDLYEIPFTARPVLFYYNTRLEEKINEENSTSLQSIIRSAATIIEENNATGSTFFLPRASDLLTLFSVYDLVDQEKGEIKPIVMNELFKVVKNIREIRLDADIHHKSSLFQYLISQNRLLAFTGDSQYIAHLKKWLGTQEQEQWYFTLFRNPMGNLLKGDYIVADKNSTISDQHLTGLIEYLVFDEENQNTGFETYGFFSVLTSLYNLEFLTRDDPFLGGYEEYQTIYRGIQQGYIEKNTEAVELKKIIQEGIYNVLAGVMDIETALKYIQEQAGAL